MLFLEMIGLLVEFAMYKQTNINLYTSNFFVLTDQNNVYKCLYNNKGGQSTVKPAGFFYNAFYHIRWIYLEVYVHN